MKKNRLFMLGLVTVFVAVLSLTLVSSTFARYSSTVTGEDSARVAKWEFKVDSQVIIGETPQDLTFDLFRADGIYELDNNGNVTVANDEEVKDGTSSEPIIAPGTGGSYTFVIKNTSEVAANVKASYSAIANNIPLEFSTSNTNDSWKTLEQINTEIEAGKDLAVGDADGYTITLYWRWALGASELPSDSTNIADTTLGIGGTATYNITITIVAIQKD